MHYQPGTHLIATLQTKDQQLLNQFGHLRRVVDQLIREHCLQKLGEVYHNFLPAGFTAVVCLSESHISIHTWPEYGRVNVDVYLSNYLRNNDGTVQSIYRTLQQCFGATVIDEQFIRR